MSSEWQFKYGSSGRWKVLIWVHKGDVLEVVKEGSYQTKCSFVEIQGDTIRGGPYVIGRQTLPHPQSKTSYQRIMKRIGKALQIVEGGPEGNCVIDWRKGNGVTISKQYYDAVSTLEKYRAKIERLESHGRRRSRSDNK